MKFRYTLTAGLAVALLGTTTSWAETLDVASTYPKNMPFLGESAEVLAKNVETVTGGALKLTIHGAGDLVPPLDVLPQVSSGAIPAGWDWIGYWGGTLPVTSLAGAMPFGLSPAEFVGWMWEGGGMEIVQKAYDPLNVKFLPCSVTAPEPGGWFNKEINSVEDLRGLRMRISGLGGQALNRLGASTQMIPAGELYVALERGRIDATEFSLPSIDKSLGFAQIAKYYYFPGWHQPASWNSFIINMDVWNGFDETTRNAVTIACQATVAWSLAAGPQPQPDVIEEFKAKGVEVRRFPDSVLLALREASTAVLEEEAAKDAVFKEAYESMMAYAEKSRTWTDLQVLPVSE